MIPERLQSVLDDEVRSLAAAFDQAGHPLYLVGGSVRDAMLDRKLPEGMNADRDFTTSAMPEEIERIGGDYPSHLTLDDIA